MELKNILNEMAVSAGRDGWQIKVGNQTFTDVNDLPKEAFKAFEEVRQYLRRDRLMSQIRHEHSTKPPNIVFQAPATATVYSDEGEKIKVYKLKNEVPS